MKNAVYTTSEAADLQGMFVSLAITAVIALGVIGYLKIKSVLEKNRGSL